MIRHENSWRHGRQASGTNIRKMRKQDTEDDKFASVLINAYATVASLTGMTTILRLSKARNSLNVYNKLTNHPFLLHLTLV
jgi:hypothetical protein